MKDGIHMETLIKCLEILGIDYTVEYYSKIFTIICYAIPMLAIIAFVAVIIHIDTGIFGKITAYGLSVTIAFGLVIAALTISLLCTQNETVRRVTFTCTDEQYLEIAKTGFNLRPTENPHEYVCTGRHQ